MKVYEMGPSIEGHLLLLRHLATASYWIASSYLALHSWKGKKELGHIDKSPHILLVHQCIPFCCQWCNYLLPVSQRIKGFQLCGIITRVHNDVLWWRSCKWRGYDLSGMRRKGGVEWEFGCETLAGDLWESLSCSQSTVVVCLWPWNLNKASPCGCPPWDGQTWLIFA